MAGLTTRYYNLTGGLNASQGIGTINQTPKRTDTPQSFNVELHKLGGIKTMRGNKQVGNTLGATVTLGHEYVKGSKKYLMVATADGKIYQYNNITQTYQEVYQFPTATRRHSAVNFNQGVVFTNGVDDLVYYQYGRNELQDGTVTIEDESATVTGTSTHFTQLSPGDYIYFESLDKAYKIESIASDTSLTLSEPIDIVNPTRQFYAWTLDGTTYYTTTTDNNSSNVDIYTISQGSASLQAFTGNIVNDTLQITTGSTTTVERTVTDYYCYSIQEDSGYSVVSLIRGYVYLPENPGLGSNLFTIPTASTRVSDWQMSVNYPQATSLSQLSQPTVFTFQSGTNATLTVFSLNNGLANAFSLNGNTSSRYGSLTYDGSKNITHTVQETIDTTITKVYSRDENSDATIEVATTGVSFYLGPISELNATYINSDDPSVEEQIRGLAINTWQGRLFVGGNDGTLYYSEVGLIHGWDLKYGAGAIPMFYNDNSDFTALGLYGEYLVIHRRDYTYYLLPGTGDPDTWQLVPFADISCDSQQSWLSIANSYYVYSRLNQGIFPLMRRTIFINNYLGQELSEKIADDFDLINKSAYDKIFPVFEPHRSYILFYVPMLQGKGSNYCYCYDTISKSWWLRIVPQNVTIAFRFQDRIFIGTSDGKVLEEFKGLSFDGEPIEFSYRTPWFSFGDGTNYLSTREFRVKFDGELTNHFYVRNRRNGEEKYQERLVTDNQGTIDSLIWDIGFTGSATEFSEDTLTDTTWDNFDWVDSGYVVKRFPLADQYFQTEQVEFMGKTLSDGMAIVGFEFDRVELEETPW